MSWRIKMEETLRELNIKLIAVWKEEQRLLAEREKLSAKKLTPYLQTGFYLTCKGCRTTYANKTEDKTCLGAVQEGWRLKNDVYCPRCQR